MTDVPPRSSAGSGSALAGRRAAFRLVVILSMATAVVAGLLLALHLATQGPQQPAFTAAALGPGEELYAADHRYVVDAVVGHKARRNCVTEFLIDSIDGSTSHLCRRRTNGLGWIRDDDPAEPWPKPRILLVGDSHMEGVVSTTHNAATLLESGLRARPGLEGALVINVSAAYYGLYQYVLRLRTLVERCEPAALIVVVFAGNDLLELEDVSRPHLDDRCAESEALASPPPETTSSRMAWLGVPEAFFWQGQNQAAYLLRHPDRRDSILAKSKRCLQLLKDEAAAARAHLELVLLPPYELVFPDRVAALGDAARRVIESGVQAALYDELRAQVAEAGISSIDMLPVIRDDGREHLYASDLHIFVDAHALLARELRDKLGPILEPGGARAEAR